MFQRRELVPLNDSEYKLSSEERLRRSQLEFRVVELKQFMAVMSRARDQHWLSAYSGLDATECQKRVITTMIDGQPPDMHYQRCYVSEVGCCKTEANRLVDTYGMGLRRMRVRARADKGCITVLLTKQLFKTVGLEIAPSLSAGPSSALKKPAVPSAPAKKDSEALRIAQMEAEIARRKKAMEEKRNFPAPKPLAESRKRPGADVTRATTASAKVPKKGEPAKVTSPPKSVPKAPVADVANLMAKLMRKQ